MPPPGRTLRRLSDAEIRKLFNQLDTDGSGDITLAELEQAGKDDKLGPLYSYESCKSFLELADTDGSNSLDFEEFKAWVNDRETVLRNLFQRMDVNNSGSVCSKDLKDGLIELGCEVSTEHAERIIEKLDADKSGTLEYEELLRATLIFPGDTKDIIRKVLLKGQSFMMFEDNTSVVEVPGSRILCAGILSGSLARTLTAPQDRIAMNMRAGGHLIQGQSSPLTVAKELVKKGGIGSLWIGNGVNCIKDGPRSGLTFLAYERYKELLLQDPGKPNILEKFMCGGLAGFSSMTLTYPLFVAQARIAVAEKGTYSGLIDCFRKTLSVEGIRGIIRGYDAAALSTAPERGISLMTYMTLRDYFVREGNSPTVAQSLGFGAVSSLVAQITTAPMQTVMVRLMTQGESFGRPVVYYNAADCIRKIVCGAPNLNLPAEGYRALYRGLSAHLFKMIPGTAIQFAAFEFFSDLVQPITG